MSRSAIIAISLVVIILIGVSLYYTLRYEPGQPGEPAPPPPPASRHETITAKHQFKDGKHIVAGEVNVPTPCHILNTDARVAESAPEQVTIAFEATTRGDDEVCAQVLTPARFKVEFQASEQAVMRATWNGDPVDLNLIPAGPGENLEDFEIYIKG